MVLNTDNKVISKLKRLREERKVSVGMRVAKGTRTGCYWTLKELLFTVWKISHLFSYCHIRNLSNHMSACSSTSLSSHWISRFCIYFKETSAFLPSKGLYIFLNNAEITMKIEFNSFPLCCAFFIYNREEWLSARDHQIPYTWIYIHFHILS